ncbi:MAG TPA: four helix bundle protein [Candidatus Marinimicrobia bacterium]|jgi:four helix bundle protein|nr:four helix bundle protein [Candidatus Neomarinimicrobiota bacterium]
MSKKERFEDMEAWQEARAIVSKIYDLCKNDSFRKNFNLTNQIQRAAISIIANIAEGFGRRGNKEFAQFLFIAKASAAELQSHLYIAFNQKYI